MNGKLAYEKSSQSLITEKMQIKTRINYHYSLIRMSKIFLKIKDNIQC